MNNTTNICDLSINGIKINITDISSNNFFQNRNFSSLHTSSNKKYNYDNNLPPIIERNNQNKTDISPSFEKSFN